MIAGAKVRLRAGRAEDTDRLLVSLTDWSIAEWLPGVPFPHTAQDAAAMGVVSLALR
jgi:hypothetical protein